MAIHPNSGFGYPFGPVISGSAHDTTNPSLAWGTVTVDRTVGATPTNAPSTTNVTPKSSKGDSTWAIVGGLLGGLTFIAILVVALILCRRCRRHPPYPSPTPLIHDPNYTQPSRRNEKFVQVLQEQDETRGRRDQSQTMVEERNGERDGSTPLQIELLSQRILALETQQRECDDREWDPEVPPDYSS